VNAELTAAVESERAEVCERRIRQSSTTPTMKAAGLIYMARAHTTGGRNGAAHTPDGRLNVKLGSPFGGGVGTNPEQLFAAAWSACFMTSLEAAANQIDMTLPPGSAVEIEIDLGATEGRYWLRARLRVHLPGMERKVSQTLVAAAHQKCPYSRITRHNIEVAINVA